MGSVLFIQFHSLKCMIEDSVEHCDVNTLCASFISIFLIFWWLLKLVQGLKKQEWRKDLSLSMEKVAKMNISIGRTAQGVFVAVMAGCGAFLFALMSAKNPDKYLVRQVGLTGLISGVVCVIFEIFTMVKEQERRTWSQLTQPISALTEELVDGCSWWYVAATFLVTTFYEVLMFMYTIISSEDLRIWQVSNMILPMVFLHVYSNLLEAQGRGSRD